MWSTQKKNTDKKETKQINKARTRIIQDNATAREQIKERKNMNKERTEQKKNTNKEETKKIIIIIIIKLHLPKAS